MRFDIEHRALVLAAVVEAGAFLEAVANELFVDCADDHASYTRPLPAQAVAALRDRWRQWHTNGRSTVPTLEKFEAALECCAATPFDKSCAPHQDATSVIHLRNAVVHFTPEWVAADQRHKFECLKSRFAPNALMQGSGDAYFPNKCLGAGCAAWAATTVHTFADDFYARLSITPNYQSSLFS